MSGPKEIRRIPVVSFFIDPSATKEAVLSGRGLLVEVFNASEYRVEVMPRADTPPHMRPAA